MKKLAIVFAALALSLPAAQKFNLRVFHSATLGGTEIKPGDYRVELINDKVILKNGKASLEATARIENDQKRFPSTTMKIVDGAIEEIRLGGTSTRLVFNR